MSVITPLLRLTAPLVLSLIAAAQMFAVDIPETGTWKVKCMMPNHGWKMNEKVTVSLDTDGTITVGSETYPFFKVDGRTVYGRQADGSIAVIEIYHPGSNISVSVSAAKDGNNNLPAAFSYLGKPQD